jgi:hypothetical protein
MFITYVISCCFTICWCLRWDIRYSREWTPWPQYQLTSIRLSIFFFLFHLYWWCPLIYITWCLCRRLGDITISRGPRHISPLLGGANPNFKLSFPQTCFLIHVKLVFQIILLWCVIAGMMAPEKSWCLVESLARWEPQEEGVMNTAARFSLS